MSSFPLFRLPFLALNNAFRQMELIEIIELSLTSKKAKNSIRTVFQKALISMHISIGKFLPILEFMIDFEPELSFELSNILNRPTEAFLRRFEGVSVDTVTYNYAFNPLRPMYETFWDDEVVGMDIILNYFLEIFPKIKIDLEFCDGPKEFKWMVLNVIEEREPSLDVVKLEKGVCSDELCGRIARIGRKAEQFIVE